ncbi:MAG TPA: PKD domain-containing protein, partial [bacterium]|nr:PKD domain-containing protein [bacterium]
MPQPMPSWTLPFLAAIAGVLLLLPACGGGSSTTPPPTDPPVITAVTPTGAVGIEAAEVTFSVTTTNGPTQWLWNFGGASAGGATSMEASPTITLGRAGTFQCAVMARNAAGSSSPFPFELRIDAAPQHSVSSVSPTGAVGRTGELVRFTANTDQDGLQWEWRFGRGAIPNLSTEESPRVTLQYAGTHRGSVMASRPGSGAVPVTVEFEFSVEAGTVFAASTELGSYEALDIAVVDGRPAVLLMAVGLGFEGPLQLAVAELPLPTTADDWTFVGLDGTGAAAAEIAADGATVTMAYVVNNGRTLRAASVDAAALTMPGAVVFHEAALLPGEGYPYFTLGHHQGHPVMLPGRASGPVQLLVGRVSKPQSVADWFFVPMPMDYHGDVDLAAGLDQVAVTTAATSAGVPSGVEQRVDVTAPGQPLGPRTTWHRSSWAYTLDALQPGGAAVAFRGPLLAVAYVDRHGVQLAQALAPTPARASDWRVSTVIGRELRGTETQPPDGIWLRLVGTANGWGAAYGRLEGIQSTVDRLAQTSNPDPASPSDWSHLVVAQGGFSLSPHNPFLKGLTGIALAAAGEDIHLLLSIRESGPDSHDDRCA